ncbi:hypothetical protein ABH925_007042 [Streptacidiphilus sp. EB129]|jgi:hypothetical protein
MFGRKRRLSPAERRQVETAVVRCSICGGRVPLRRARLVRMLGQDLYVHAWHRVR